MGYAFYQCQWGTRFYAKFGRCRIPRTARPHPFIVLGCRWKELAAVATIWSFDAFNEGSDFGVFVTLNFIVEVNQAKVFFEAWQKLPMKWIVPKTFGSTLKLDQIWILNHHRPHLICLRLGWASKARPPCPPSYPEAPAHNSGSPDQVTQDH